MSSTRSGRPPSSRRVAWFVMLAAMTTSCTGGAIDQGHPVDGGTSADAGGRSDGSGAADAGGTSDGGDATDAGGTSDGGDAADATGGGDAPPSTATRTLTTTRIALSAPEIANPQRGAFEQYGVAPPPSGWPYRDLYTRWTWRQFEPTENGYVWSLIDDQVAGARARGGRFGMRVMPADSVAGDTCMPQYLMDVMPLGFWFTYPGGSSMYAPDWNDTDYMARAEAMIRAIAARYATDDGFGWIEMGPYGDWSEWHVWQWPYPSPTGAQDMTLANRQRLIDIHVEVFPPEKLVQMIDSATGTNPTMGYALAQSPLIGVRGDCFGDALFDMRMGELNAAASDRWKTAPILVEFCGGGAGQYTAGLRQVQEHHVAMVGGNFGSYASHSAEERQDFDDLRKLAGYRFALDSLTVPAPITRGAAASFAAAWTNLGTTPAHHGWDVTYQLASGSEVVWEGPSSLDVRTLLPGSSTITDTFTVPLSVAAGTWSLRVIVRGADGSYGPMQLSITGQATDGAYPLGDVDVQ